MGELAPDELPSRSPPGRGRRSARDEEALGSMGAPPRVVVSGRSSSSAARAARRLKSDPAKYLPNCPPNHAHDRRDHHLLDPPSRPGDRARAWPLAVLGRLGLLDHAGRRDPRPVGEPGHRLHRLEGARPARDRGPGDLPAGPRPAGAPRRARGAVVERRRLLDDQRDLRRRRRLRRGTQARGRAAGSDPGPSFPPALAPQLAPDALATGQIFWYTVEGAGLDLGRLRAIQDWYVRPQLASVAGVAEVSSVGGFPSSTRSPSTRDGSRRSG